MVTESIVNRLVFAFAGLWTGCVATVLGKNLKQCGGIDHPAVVGPPERASRANTTYAFSFAWSLLALHIVTMAKQTKKRLMTMHNVWIFLEVRSKNKPAITTYRHRCCQRKHYRAPRDCYFNKNTSYVC